MPESNSDILIVTGADANHFANLTVLIGSWIDHMSQSPMAVCDYGLLPEQVQQLQKFPGLVVLPPPHALVHPWQGKSLTGKYLEQETRSWDVMMWTDADALFACPLPALRELIDGYQLILDAHVMSIGEIMPEPNRQALAMRKDDTYFSSGWWVVRKGLLLDSFARLSSLVERGPGLWENDAFVASVYHEKLKIRTVNGCVWHSRGKTSIHTCEVKGLVPLHAGQPIYILHANDGYTLRKDKRRIFKRKPLARIQDHYEETFKNHVR